MPRVEWFAYCWPNRRSEKTVVEITLDFTAADQERFPLDAAQVRDLLIKGGILEKDEVFPEQDLPDERMAWYTSLLVQTALLFQRKAGHRVNFITQTCYAEHEYWIALMEHEHCDVGMTAVKLATELVSGKRRLLEEPFRMFTDFARKRLLPIQTEAIIRAAQRRDIPAIRLERQPYKREDFTDLTKGRTVCPNGLLMLGHGKYQRVLDGTWSLDLQQDLSSGEDEPDQVAEKILDRLFP
ncbi:MAG: hypothetical protein OQJ84_10175, partial [Xanthomonadales bacterium]|nr:hypothetical protein [Xanthomonadales bacterium]